MLHEGSMKERELYAPIKAHFEAQGYEVKGEVGAADVMARRGSEPAVIIELKLAFSLTVFHQALERLKLVDDVYIAVLRPEGKAGMKRLKANVTLCRRLGLGLLTVRPRDLFVSSTARRAPTGRARICAKPKGSSRPLTGWKGIRMKAGRRGMGW
jgi:hypothetical protein